MACHRYFTSDVRDSESEGPDGMSGPNKISIQPDSEPNLAKNTDLDTLNGSFGHQKKLLSAILGALRTLVPFSFAAGPRKIC